MMIKPFYIWIILMTVVSIAHANGATKDPWPVEKLKIIHDRDLYLEGDTIWLKIINTDQNSGRMQHLSSTVYVELLGRGEQLVTRTKIAMNDAIGNGWLRIPDDLYSGNYYLRAYTSWMKNLPPEQYAYSILPVVNPARPLYSGQQNEVADENISVQAVRMDQTEKEGLTVKMDLENINYQCGEMVGIAIDLSDNGGRGVEGNCSFSVFLSDVPLSRVDGDLKKQLSQDYLFNSLFTETPFNKRYYPELAGPAISGILVDKDTGEPVHNALISCTSLGSASQYQVFRTGADGKFRFVPRTNQIYTDIVFSIADIDQSIDIQIDDPFSPGFLEVPVPALHLDKNQVHYIEQLSLNRQVTKAFRGESGIIQTKKPDAPVLFYGGASESVVLDRYIKLPVMEEIFRELVKTVIVYRSKGALKLGVIDESTREIIGDRPLFLLDGVPQFDHGSILEIDPNLLEYIHVVDSKYFIGELEFDGIIDMRSREGNYADFEFPTNTLTYSFQSCSNIDDPVPQKQSSGSVKIPGSHLPDFRTLLYWNPEVITNETGRAEFSFTAPDVQGFYRIEVNSITPGGKTGSESMEIVVE
jgi:hypothetical protein